MKRAYSFFCERRFSLVHIAFAVMVLLNGAQLSAQWSLSPNNNNIISTAASDQYYPTIASDGAGGSIITWFDLRSGTNFDIYAQRIDSAGVVQWTADGVAISTATNHQYSPTIVSDGAGGAIIAWYDGRSGTDYDIYAQRINAAGIVQWTADGVAITTGTGEQYYPAIASDGAGGAIITWQDHRSGGDVYAQRVNAAGAVQWTANGVAISTAADNQYNPIIVGDGAGGAVITWADFRNSNPDVYAQRINAAGAVQWTADGVAITIAAGGQYSPTIMSDNAGGAIITWYDGDVYAQRINAAGSVQWTANGIAISAATGSQSVPTIVSDNAGGAIITWQDTRNGNPDVYAQRINAAGSVLWAINDVAISTATGSQSVPTIVSDNAGGAIITWADLRSGNLDVYAQRINAAGSVQWTGNGVAITAAANGQESPTIVSNGAGGAIITWYDNRSGNYDIYAQKINYRGMLGNLPSPHIVSINDISGDQGGKVRVKWGRSALDTSEAGAIQIVTYGVWRKIPPGMKPEKMNPAPTLLVDDTLGTLYDFIVSIPAVQSPQYNTVSPTLDDSSASGTHPLTLLVTAHTSNPNVYFISGSDSGYSVDNLAPGAIPSLAVQNIGDSSIQLMWPENLSDNDLGEYVIYRSTVSGFPLNDSTRLTTSTGTIFTDLNPPTTPAVYYRVTATDVHDNEGQPSPEEFTTFGTTQQYNMDAGWNMVSVALTMSNYTKTVLFPTATSDAIAYQGSYVPQPVLTNTPGYWLKFGGDQSISLTGLSRSVDTIVVSTGWNMIGSISSPVAVTSIGSIPSGIITSGFFRYGASGYSTTSEIEPGQGYWVKVSQNGSLVLSSTAPDVASRRER